jgi:hypothetical protein
MKYTTYTTTSGEFWTTIADKMYGDVNEAKRIIDANPQVPITNVLDGGIELKIPIIEATETQIDPNNLPPWKR